MTDTAQPTPAAETVVVSESVPDREAEMRAAADAFKAEVGQAPTEPKRDASGRFASEQEEEIEAPEEEESEAGAESQDETEEGEEAAEEAQPTDPDLPTSWPAEHEETWKSLPPEAKAIIAEREGQRDAAVNAKFQEAANLRKAHEAEISEAQANRTKYLEAVDQVLSLVVPQPPSRSLLDVNSADYDPDAYHYRKAQYEDTVAYLQQHAAQRQQLAAQEQMQRFEAINNATRDHFIKEVPDVADQAKAPAIFQGLMEYAVSLGTPAEVFGTPTTAVEWLVLHKAREYDRLQEAKAKVRTDPKPEPKKAQPAVRPGVATSRSASKHASYQKAVDRLEREGSIAAGAAIWKHHL
jgi:hypothetical protein